MNVFLLERFATATPTTEGNTEDGDSGGFSVKTLITPATSVPFTAVSSFTI